MQNFVKTLFASVLSIGLFLLLFGSVVLFQVEHHLSKNQIVKVVKQIDVVEVLENTNTESEDATESSFMTELYQEASSLGISEETVNSFLNSNAVKETVGTIVGNLTESALTGETKELMTVEEWEKMLEEAMEGISQEENISITDQQKEQFLDEIKSHSETIVKSFPTTEEFTKEVGTEWKIVHFIFSNQIKAMLVGSILLVSLLIFLLKRKEKSFLLYLGTPLVILSIIFILGGMAIPFLSELLTVSSSSTTLIHIAMENIRNSILICGVISLVLAIFCFVCYGVSFKKTENHEKAVTKDVNL